MNEESLFHHALAQSAGPDRAAFLDHACAGQPDLRAAVDALLSAHAESGGLLGAPVEAVLLGSAIPHGDTLHQNGTTDPERPRPPDDPPVPKRIGRYEIRKLLGRGGMGAVYLAHDPELDRLVALKVPKLAGHGAEERFLREARAAAAVSHPNLCPVYDAGRGDGVLYLAMAYVPGSTLTELLKAEGPLLPARATAMAATIARAMAEAHRHGIVHRDLKPGNVLLNHLGEPVVTDFGLALRDPGPAANDEHWTADFQPRLTQAGIMMGTPIYMPPEQACGDLEKVGPASDVYALGAILFEMLTGRPPFCADTIAQLMRKIVAEPPPHASRVRPGIPTALGAVCARALAKEPAERFASMADFAAELAASGASRGRRRTGIAVAVAASFLLLAVVAAVFYVKTDHGTIEVRLNDPKADVQVSVDGGRVQLKENGRLTNIRSGPHGLVVEGPGFVTETRLFKVTRGKTTVVEVELKRKVPDPTPPPSDIDRANLARILARGQKAIGECRYADLGPLADQALQIDPESPTALALRATFRMAIKHDPEGARADTEAALKLNPETYQALIIRGAVNIDDKPQEAIADETVAIRLEPKNPVAWANRAKSFLDLKEYHQAIKDANKAIELKYALPIALLNRGSAHVCLGEYQKALADYNDAVRICAAQNDPSALIHRSALHARMGNAKMSADDWSAALRINPTLGSADRLVFPDPPKPLVRKKLSDKDATDLEAALAAFKRTWGEGNIEACKRAAEVACRIDPTSSIARANQARIWGQTKHFKEAIIEATEAIRLDANNAMAYSDRAGARNCMNDFVGGIADATIAVQLQPELAKAWNNRACGYIGRGQYHQALADATEAVKRGPGLVEPYATRVSTYVQLGEYTKALDDYRTLIGMAPGSPEWWMLRSVVRARLDDPDGAKADRERAIKIDHNLEGAPLPILPPPLPPVKKDPEPEAVVPAAPNAERARLAQILARGWRLLEDGLFADLGKVADEALAIDAESPGALAFRATYRLVRDELDDARADADAALRLNPETFQALVVRDRVNYEKDRFDDSIADGTIAIRLVPSNPGPYVNRGRAYLAKKEYRQVVNDCSAAIDRGFVHSTPRINRASAYVRLGEYEKALADYDFLVNNGVREAKLFLERSTVNAKLGNVAQSAADWAMAKKLKPDLKEGDRFVVPPPPNSPKHKTLTAEQAAAVAAHLREAEKAYAAVSPPGVLAAADAALKIDSTSAAARSWRARALVELGGWKDILDESAESLALAPDDPWLYHARGIARGATVGPAAAIADLTIALTLNKDNAGAWGNRGYAYSLRGQYHQGIVDLDEALRRETASQFLANRGSCFVHLGRYDKALADYRALTEREPGNGQRWLHYSVLEAKLGNPDAARKARDKAIEIDETLKDASFPIPAPLPPVKIDPVPSIDDPPALQKPKNNPPEAMADVTQILNAIEADEAHAAVRWVAS